MATLLSPQDAQNSLVVQPAPQPAQTPSQTRASIIAGSSPITKSAGESRIKPAPAQTVVVAGHPYQETQPLGVLPQAGI